MPSIIVVLSFVEISLRDHTLFFSLPNAELAIAILHFTLSDEFGTTDPKNLNSSKFLYFHFFTMMFVRLLEKTLHL